MSVRSRASAERRKWDLMERLDKYIESHPEHAWASPPIPVNRKEAAFSAADRGDLAPLCALIAEGIGEGESRVIPYLCKPPQDRRGSPGKRVDLKYIIRDDGMEWPDRSDLETQLYCAVNELSTIKRLLWRRKDERGDELFSLLRACEDQREAELMLIRVLRHECKDERKDELSSLLRACEDEREAELIRALLRAYEDDDLILRVLLRAAYRDEDEREVELSSINKDVRLSTYEFAAWRWIGPPHDKWRTLWRGWETGRERGEDTPELDHAEDAVEELRERIETRHETVAAKKMGEIKPGEIVEITVIAGLDGKLLD